MTLRGSGCALQFAKPMMYPLHEAMEVDPLLARTRRDPIELVHDEALAAPDRPPQVDAGYAAGTAQHA